MIIKLAFDPLTTAAAVTGLKAATAAAAAGKVVKDGFKHNLINTMVSGNLHDLPHYLTTKSNWGGKQIQKAAISDIMISTKKGTEGKVWANRKLIPSLFYSGNEAKSIATFESNLAATKGIGVKYLFKGNEFKTNRLKNVLRSANAVDKTALVGQVAAPTYMGGKAFKDEYKRSGNVGTATRKGMMGAATGGLISAGLVIPRKIAGSAAEMHQMLKANNNYGYHVFEEASKSAKASLERPGIINYSKHFYTTPEKNVKAFAGRVFGDNLKRVMGQKTVKKWDKVNGYTYDNTPKKGILAKIDEFGRKTTTTVLGV